MVDYENLMENSRDRDRRVVCLDVGGKRLWLKRTAKNYHHLGQRIVGEAIRFLLFRDKASLPLTEEIESLKAVQARGIPTPEVVHVGEDYVVLTDMGPTVQSLMRQADDAGRLELICQVSRALRKLHDAKGWHGGMAVKNLTLSPDGIAMIDFEAHFVKRWPLKLRQANDLLGLCLSLLAFAHAGRLIAHALRCYRA